MLCGFSNSIRRCLRISEKNISISVWMRHRILRRYSMIWWICWRQKAEICSWWGMKIRVFTGSGRHIQGHWWNSKADIPGRSCCLWRRITAADRRSSGQRINWYRKIGTAMRRPWPQPEQPVAVSRRSGQCPDRDNITICWKLRRTVNRRQRYCTGTMRVHFPSLICWNERVCLIGWKIRIWPFSHILSWTISVILFICHWIHGTGRLFWGFIIKWVPESAKRRQWKRLMPIPGDWHCWIWSQSRRMYPFIPENSAGRWQRTWTIWGMRRQAGRSTGSWIIWDIRNSWIPTVWTVVKQRSWKYWETGRRACLISRRDYRNCRRWSGKDVAIRGANLSCRRSIPAKG